MEELKLNYQRKQNIVGHQERATTMIVIVMRINEVARQKIILKWIRVKEKGNKTTNKLNMMKIRKKCWIRKSVVQNIIPLEADEEAQDKTYDLNNYRKQNIIGYRERATLIIEIMMTMHGVRW